MATPINPNASQKAKDVLNYLYSISGTKTLTGMHNFFEDPNYWSNIVKNDFGDYPAVQGFEMGALLGQDFATQANMRQATVNAVINHSNRGGICHMSWHQNFAFKPFEWNAGVKFGPIPQADFDRLVTPGTAEYNWLISEYDRAAPYFKQIRDANVPLVMRPYHEMNAPWFWWGHQPNYSKLWDIMYDRFTNVYGLNNLLWLWSANNPKNAPYERPYPEYFVGTNKCDILGTDIYLWVTNANKPTGEPYRPSDHDELVAISGGKPVVLSEIGHVINESILNTTRFVWFLEWGDYYREPIVVWTGDAVIQNTQADRANMFGASVSRNLNLSEVSIGTSPPDTQAPTVPTNLAVPSKTTTSVFLSWTASTDNVGVTGYDVYKNDVFLATSPTNSYNAVGLVADTSYTFKVRAKDAAGNLSAFTANISAKTDVVNTNFVRGINFAGGSVTVEGQTWLAGSDATITYSANKLEYVNSPALTPSPAVDSQTSAMLNSNIYSLSGDFSVSQPLPNGSYQVYVWALENYQTNFRSFNLKLEGVQVTPSPIGLLPVNGWQKFGPYSVTVADGVLNMDVIKVTGDPALHGMAIYKSSQNDTLAPTTPTNVTAPSKTSTSVNLMWTASTDNVGVTGYDVYEGSTLKGTTTTTSFTVTGLTASTAYSFTIKAKDAAGNVSQASTPLSVTTNAPADTTAPTAPTGLTSPSKTSTTVDLSWTASTDAVGVTGYDVFKDGVLVGSTASTTFKVTGLSASVSYNFTVRAKDAAGNLSPFSTSLTVTTGAVNTSFVRGINFGGPAVTIGGQSWIAGNNPLITLSSGVRTYTNSPSINPVPTVDSATSSMLNSDIYSSGNFTVSQPLSNGSYQVYIWSLENYQSNFRSFHLKLGGTQVTSTPIGQNALYGWKKYGPYSVTVTNGTLTMELVKVTGDPAIQGMEIYTSVATDSQAPSTPTNLTVQTKSTTSVSLSWTASTDNNGVTAYEIFKGDTLAGTSTSTNFNVTGLNANTTYSFKVRAKDAAGNLSPFSTNLTVTTNAVNTGFVRGINFGGPAVTIGGQSWIAGNNPLITLSSGVNSYTNSPSISPVPAVDSATSSMLNSDIYSSGSFTVSQPLPNGSYQVYIWSLENYQSNFRSFHLKLGGTQVTTTPIGQNTLYRWKKYGPYNVTITNGTLTMELVKVTGDPAIQGMEIYGQ